MAKAKKIKVSPDDITRYNAELDAVRQFPVQARIAKDLYKKGVTCEDFEEGGKMRATKMKYTDVVVILQYLKKIENGDIDIAYISNFACTVPFVREEEKQYYEQKYCLNYHEMIHEPSGRIVIQRYMVIYDKNFRKGTYAIAFLDNGKIISTHTDLGLLNKTKDVKYTGKKNPLCNKNF